VLALGVYGVLESSEVEVPIRQIYFEVSVSLLRWVSIVLAGECDQGYIVGLWHALEPGGIWI
jgi:hypothetical protein